MALGLRNICTVCNNNHMVFREHEVEFKTELSASE